MAEKTFNTRLLLKGDTYANWTQSNPVPLKNELCVVTIPAEAGAVAQEPAILFKVGDGESAFNALPFASGIAADVYDWAKEAQKPVYAAEEITGLSAYIAGKIDDTDTQYQVVKAGDMGFKLQSKPKEGGEWTDVSTITLTAPVYTLEEGTTNGTVSFNNSDVHVHGLGSAAFTDANAYDAAGSADGVKTQLIGTDADTAASDTIKGAKKYADDKIASQLSAVYRPAGSVAFSGLPTPSEDVLGNVYNVTDEFITTESFVEGAGKEHPAGTNVVVVSSGDGYLFDVLAGFVDLSGLEAASHTHANKTVLDTITSEKTAAWDAKVDDADLAAIAKTGNVNDLVQTSGDVIIFDCGSATVNI